MNEKNPQAKGAHTTPETASNSHLDVLVVLGKNWSDQAKGKTSQLHGYVSQNKSEHRPGFYLSRDSALSTVAAASLYLQGKTESIIFSTGKTLEGQPSEAEAMKDYLRTYYNVDEIPDEAISLEATSIDTAGNAEETHAMLEGVDHKKVGLLTVGYHTRRSRKLFKQYGIEIEKKNVFKSEEVLGLGKTDPERGLVKSAKEHATEAILNTLLVVDPYGKLPRKVTRSIRK